MGRDLGRLGRPGPGPLAGSPGPQPRGGRAVRLPPAGLFDRRSGLDRAVDSGGISRPSRPAEPDGSTGHVPWRRDPAGLVRLGPDPPARTRPPRRAVSRLQRRRYLVRRLGRVRGIKEGDSPSFLFLVPNGLAGPSHPGLGSWGGRFEGEGSRFVDVPDPDRSDPADPDPRMSSVYRWRPDFQADFQARMDWCIQPFDDANHPPVVRIVGENARARRGGRRDPARCVRLDRPGRRRPDVRLVGRSIDAARGSGPFRQDGCTGRPHPARRNRERPDDSGPPDRHGRGRSGADALRAGSPAGRGRRGFSLGVRRLISRCRAAGFGGSGRAFPGAICR